MLKFRFTYLWVLLAVFLSGKIHSGICKQNLAATYKEQTKALKENSKKSVTAGTAKFSRQKIKKPKGKRVVTPQIYEVNFAGLFIYTSFKLSYTEQVYLSFQHCLNLKRGPPVV